jgi:GT2 family glycosyltransferase
MRLVSNGRVAIIIPVHNRLSHTKRIVSELRRSEYPEGLIIIVDDGSSDGTSDYLAEQHPDVVVVRGSGDLWWSGAANVGCRVAIERGAEVIVLFNNDNLRLSPNCVTELVRCVETYRGCASSVALEEASPQRLRHAGGLISWPSRGIVLREAGAIYRPGPHVVECDWLPGMSLAFSSQVFAEVGGFDDRAFPQYRGDTDFTLRARALGKPCVVSYACWVTNDPTQSGMNFYSRVSLNAFVSGLFSLRSNYQLRSTFRFASRYCPPRFIPVYLTLFYLRYAYATVKTWSPLRPRVPAPR